MRTQNDFIAKTAQEIRDRERSIEQEKQKSKFKNKQQISVIVSPPISPVDTQIMDNICLSICDMIMEQRQINDEEFNDQKDDKIEEKQLKFNITQETMKIGLFNSLQTILLNLPIDEIQSIQVSTLYWLIHSSDYISKCKMIEIGVTKVLVKLSRHNNEIIGENIIDSITILVTAAKKSDKESQEFKLKTTEQSSQLLPQMKSEGLLEALFESEIAKPAPKQKNLQGNSKIEHTTAVTICDIYEDSVIPKKYRDGVIEQFNSEIQSDDDTYTVKGAQQLS
ncbi:MAG: hypothetical protein EZS28_035625 [Streblomastix strix]|uniref:Uncharacterized protein n=1 Tax=Streblomastix strix TaxID=222440 RepID=A0A5J4UEM2_9EUKA|nr:MAG: hypothetical protein EZS28_035625 [Streblomastix strix]